MVVATRYRDRIDGGRELARALERYCNTQTVVFGLPQGGAITAKTVADELGLPCDLLIAKKLGYPHNPEYAIGAVTPEGDVELDEAVAASLPEGYLEEEIERKTREAREQKDQLIADRPTTNLAGKTAILVDDGIATGYTMRAAIRAIRRRGATRVVVAAPVAPHDVFVDFHDVADEIVVPWTPPDFRSVGQFYEGFEPVTDQQVTLAMTMHDDLRDRR